MKALGIYAAVMLGLCWLAFLWLSDGDPVYATALFGAAAIGGLIGSAIVALGLRLIR